MPELRPRSIGDVIDAIRSTEGAGFPIRRPFPTHELQQFDPFLLIDEMGPVDYAPGEAVGAPHHPHRGFETVTYMLAGEFQHQDSVGNRGRLKPGDVQWMTAGRGIIHDERPSDEIVRDGGRVHGFQIWVNLPAALKMTEPRYQEVPGAGIPEATSEDGKVHVRVVAGEALGVSAVIETHIPIIYQDWTIQPGGAVEQPVEEDLNVGLYLFGGSGVFGQDERALTDGQFVTFVDGNAIRMAVPEDASEPLRLLLLAGRPIGEPVARRGPFVMNTDAEIKQAMVDYRDGTLA